MPLQYIHVEILKTTGRQNELYLAVHQQLSNTSTSC